MRNLFKNKLTDDSFAASMRRYEAFFHGEVADRPPVSGIAFWKENPGSERPAQKTYATHKERWMDVEYRAKEVNYHIDNTEYYADTMPTVFPNLGPEIFSAYCGCPYEFRPETTWTTPCVFDWAADADKAVMNRNSEYFRATEQFTLELLRYSKDKFAVGFTDCHAGGDHIAALRDPEVMCTDLYDYPEEVKAKLASSYREYYKFYDYFYNMITLTGEPTTAWIPLVVEGRYNVVQNDFSCMVGAKMFEEFFLDGLNEECSRLDRSIYHLDGPDALVHLDNILSIKKLNAVQWVYGSGNEGYRRWIKVYQRIQQAHKGVYIDIDLAELDEVFATLKPDGLWFSHIRGIGDKETADRVLERIRNWK